MASSTTVAPVQTIRKKRVFRLGNRGGLAGYFFVAPSLIFLMLFVIYPIAMSFYYSFTFYDLMSEPRWTGGLNYQNLVEDHRFVAAGLNTLYFAFGTVSTGVITSLLLAMLINRQIRAIYSFRALFYMPVVSSFVSVSLIWLWIYEPQFGLANEAFETLGFPRSKFLKGPDTAMLAIITLSVWKNMGLNMVIYLAGLQGIPPHIYESAEIDGAGAISKFLRITVPLLKPTTFFRRDRLFHWRPADVRAGVHHDVRQPADSLRRPAGPDGHDRDVDLLQRIRIPEDGIRGDDIGGVVHGHRGHHHR